jgi:3-deoxy-D-manno-octulosonic-acid transferase
VRILPADIPSAWKRTFRYEAPNLLLLSESELWWTWFKQLASKHCPIVLISANIAIETARVLSMSKICFDIAPNMYVAAQSEAVRCRFGSIGVPDDHIVVSGSLKWHCLPPISRQDMRSGIGVAGDEPVVVFGSARRGELRTFATALRGVHDAIPESRFIIAPRHSRDYDYAERIVRETGLALQRLSTIACGAEWFAPCMIVDSHGFLSRLYAVADVSVIGGSWVPVGGHNPFEAAVYGFPLLYGPFMQQTGCTFLEGSGQAVRIDAAKGALQSALMGILGIPSQ